MLLIDANNYNHQCGTNSFSQENRGVGTKRKAKYMIDSSCRKRYNGTKEAIDELSKILNEMPLNKNNKNDVLGLTNASLIKEKYLTGDNYSKSIELVDGLKALSKHAYGFVVVLSKDGRIVAFSDNVEQYLLKDVRTLYIQCANIYECLDVVDGEKLNKILSMSNDFESEKELLCTWRLPKGKRPSRKHLKEKTILMSGHFFSTNQYTEPLFIARCGCVLSIAKTNVLTDCQTFQGILAEDTTIQQISTNVKDTLGYSTVDMINKTLATFVVSSDCDTLEHSRQKCLTQKPSTTMCVMDLYTKHGERLSFLCNLKMICDRKDWKSMKLTITAQMINPAMRNEYIAYANKENTSAMTLQNTISMKRCTRTTNITRSTSPRLSRQESSVAKFNGDSMVFLSAVEIDEFFRKIEQT